VTQRELARRSNISHQQISEIEKGKVDPHLSTCERLADALGLDLVLALEKSREP
jgi:transcriptional regulator with XRE-family HTH domain